MKQHHISDVDDDVLPRVYVVYFVRVFATGFGNDLMWAAPLHSPFEGNTECGRRRGLAGVCSFATGCVGIVYEDLVTGVELNDISVLLVVTARCIAAGNEVLSAANGLKDLRHGSSHFGDVLVSTSGLSIHIMQGYGGRR